MLEGQSRQIFTIDHHVRKKLKMNSHLTWTFYFQDIWTSRFQDIPVQS